MQAIDQGQIKNSTSRELVGIKTLAQGHFSRECVYPQKVMNCRWRTTCCSLHQPAAYTSWTLCDKKLIYSLPFFSTVLFLLRSLLSSPLIPLCPFARKWGDWLHFKPCRNTKATSVHMLPVENVHGIKFTLCVSQLSYNQQTDTKGDIHVYSASTRSILNEKNTCTHKHKPFTFSSNTT